MAQILQPFLKVISPLPLAEAEIETKLRNHYPLLWLGNFEHHSRFSWGFGAYACMGFPSLCFWTTIYDV